MLTIQAIKDLAKKYNLEVSYRHSSVLSSCENPKPISITIWFKEESVEAWETLMSQRSEIPVNIYGSRQVSGSGAIDGRLFPGYMAILDRVNVERQKVGLPIVYG